jgi:glycosyltransferase involved in cell wall biosynthesis
VSLQEGFGLPIIEGFGFGTPVITSNLDPMREVAGGAALLVDPFSLDSIGDAIVSLVHDGPLAQSLVEKGFARLAAFRSECVAEQMLQIYSSALGDPNDRGRPTTNQRKKTDASSGRSQGRQNAP